VPGRQTARSHEHRSFTFLGYTFRSRKVRARTGKYFFGFNPAVSDEAGKRIRRQIRSWRLHLRGYYGRFYKSELIDVLRGINHYLMRWATQKFKRLRRHRHRAWEKLGEIARQYPCLFAHWQFGVRP